MVTTNAATLHIYYNTHFTFTVVTQYYVTEAENEYVIRGNSAVMKCKIPSFVADFVFVESWISDEAKTFTIENTGNDYGNFLYVRWYDVILI